MTEVRFPKILGTDGCTVKRAAVIGAGSMGAGIAAQFANAGISVELLDIPGPDTGHRNAPAINGLQRQLQAGGFMHPSAAALVRVGNVEDDLNRLADVDWTVEAIIERLDIKRELYAKINKVRKAGSIVSSNTSTIPRGQLVANSGAAFAADFLITHFFNPPRIMRLVEIVSAHDNNPEIVKVAQQASETILGKTVVHCRDTPGFIANRIGCHWIAAGILEAQRLGLTPEEADGVMSVLGVPKTGVFGLADLVGLDLVPTIWGSLMSTLPAADDIQNWDLPDYRVIKNLIDAGRLGRKAKAGFYRRAADKSSETLDFATNEYRKSQIFDASTLPGGGRDLTALLDASGKYAEYAWSVLKAVVVYSSACGPEIADDAEAIDTAIALGYAWKHGPFKLADIYGAERIVERLQRECVDVPPMLAAAAASGGFYHELDLPLNTDGTRSKPTATPTLTGLSGVKAAGNRIAGNDAASLWDIGEGVACFEIHTKMNSFAAPVFDVLAEAIERGGHDFKALVLGNDDPRAFSAGADLSFILSMIREQKFAALDSYIAGGQEMFLKLKYTTFPVVAAMHGLALGGGCEFGLHADVIVAHAELNAGLPETQVGIIPGWGGGTQLMLRAQLEPTASKGPVATAQRAFANIFGAKRSTSALDARANGVLTWRDDVVMNRSQLLAFARSKAVALCEAGYTAPDPALIFVAGPSGKAALMNEIFGARAAGRLTDADVAIADGLATVLTGGPNGDLKKPITEQEMLTIERECISKLAQTPAAEARIEHMLKTGKPLRN